MSSWRDIGGGHEISFYTGEDDAVRIGLLDRHHKPDGTPCNGPGSVPFDVPENANTPDRARWQLVSVEPLTLSPSLLCQLCGDHGFIRDGKWVVA
ncbi:MAG TPA: hypothetical protein VLJ88_01670 [Propionibacteriaceae bacterium]|nr:hypothetical protein [Propionibacteriaceae bacterium]